jgi:type II secretory pathway pseudopilin PulG
MRARSDNDERLMARGRAPLPRAVEGFTFLVVLGIVVIMGVGLLAVNELWSTTRAREKEQELLFIGHQFRLAIQQYSESNPKGKQIRTYPMSLDDMLVDSRYPSIRRYLRKIYVDPMTGNNEWGLRRFANGGIYGVYSLSDDAPFKRDNFDLVDVNFKGASQYSSWVFEISSQVSASSPAVSSSIAISPTATNPGNGSIKGLR